MFSKEQFEVYRALGYHAALGLFDRRDAFAHLDLAENPQTRGLVESLDGMFPLGEAVEGRQRFAEWLGVD
jgi:hypothetical protein